MGSKPVHRRKASKNGWLTLAFIALLCNVLAPPGYMLANRPDGSAVAVVLCTAQGQVDITPDQGHAPGRKPSSDMPCAFAGHGVGVAPPAPLSVALADFAYSQGAVVLAASDLAPGRGLAAPPPPSQGPPIHL